jgi:stage V sporulation protein G
VNITQVKVFPVSEEKLKAYVSIVLDDCFLVSDLKVIQGPNGLFISMPSKRKKNGEFKDIAHPLNRETRERMERRILEEYDKVKTSGPAPAPAAPHERVEAPHERVEVTAETAETAEPPGLQRDDGVGPKVGRAETAR